MLAGDYEQLEALFSQSLKQKETMQHLKQKLELNNFFALVF